MAKNLAMIGREIFYFLTAVLVAGVLMEWLWPDIILAYFNLNYLLILWLASGVLALRGQRPSR
jgi:hypothetical protein